MHTSTRNLTWVLLGDFVRRKWRFFLCIVGTTLPEALPDSPGICKYWILMTSLIFAGEAGRRSVRDVLPIPSYLRARVQWIEVVLLPVLAYLCVRFFGLFLGLYFKVRTWYAFAAALSDGLLLVGICGLLLLVYPALHETGRASTRRSKLAVIRQNILELLLLVPMLSLAFSAGAWDYLGGHFGAATHVLAALFVVLSYRRAKKLASPGRYSTADARAYGAQRQAPPTPSLAARRWGFVSVWLHTVATAFQFGLVAVAVSVFLSLPSFGLAPTGPFLGEALFAMVVMVLLLWLTIHGAPSLRAVRALPLSRSRLTGWVIGNVFTATVILAGILFVAGVFAPDLTISPWWAVGGAMVTAGCGLILFPVLLEFPEDPRYRAMVIPIGVGISVILLVGYRQVEGLVSPTLMFCLGSGLVPVGAALVYRTLGLSSAAYRHKPIDHK